LLKQTPLLPVHRVLDIGAGLAGAARMIVTETGCCVDCIELSVDSCLISIEALNMIMDDIGFTPGFFEDASDSQLIPSPANTSTAPDVDAKPQLSLSAYVDDLAVKAGNAQRSLREGQIRFVRAVFRKQ
jgi:hypothetical protein